MEQRFENPFGIPELDLGPEYLRNPQGTTAELVRAGARCAFLPRMGTTMLLRHADVHAAFSDHRLGAIGAQYSELQGWKSGPYLDWAQRTIVFLDPPAHDRLRGLVNRAFTPRQVATVRPITEQIAVSLADAAAEQGEVDLYDAFAQLLPLQVICAMLAIPSVDSEEVGRWTAALSPATAYPSPEERIAADRAILAFGDYAKKLIFERRAKPGDDLLSALIAAEESGDQLSSDELVAMVIQMLYAGHDTTRSLIGNGVFTLLEHPDQLTRLRADPSLMKSAVEEMLRFEPPIIYVSRVAGEDMEIGGIALPAGHMVHLSIASANRDETVFPEPDTFDVARSDNQHVSFGFGAHFCLGSSVARMEARIAFETLLARFRSIEFAGDRKPVWMQDSALRTLEAFPVRLVAA